MDADGATAGEISTKYQSFPFPLDLYARAMPRAFERYFAMMFPKVSGCGINGSFCCAADARSNKVSAFAMNGIGCG